MAADQTIFYFNIFKSFDLKNVGLATNIMFVVDLDLKVKLISGWWRPTY